MKTVPDGYLIDLNGKRPKFYLVEVELATHDAYRHMLVQLSKFSELGAESRLKIRNLLVEEVKRKSDTPLLAAARAPLKRGGRRSSQEEKGTTDLLDELLLKNLKSPLPSIVVIDQITPAVQQALGKLMPKPRLIQLKRFGSKSKKETLLHVYSPSTRKGSKLVTDFETKVEEESQFFDFAVQQIDTKLVALNKHTYRFVYQCVYLPQRTYSSPIKFRLSAFTEKAKIKLIKKRGYKLLRKTGNKKGWNNQLAFETSFKAPFEKDKPLKGFIEVEIFTDDLPPHISTASSYPIKGKLSLQLDFTRLKDKSRIVKLLDFVSRRSSRPVIPSSLSLTKNVRKGKINWVVEEPQRDHMYLLLWQEPCYCSWCRHKVFT